MLHDPDVAATEGVVAARAGAGAAAADSSRRARGAAIWRPHIHASGMGEGREGLLPISLQSSWNWLAAGLGTPGTGTAACICTSSRSTAHQGSQMLVALRKSRRVERQEDSRAPSPGLALVSRCRAAAQDLAHHARAAADALGQQLAAAAAGAVPPPLDRQQRAEARPQHALLLASVTGSALEQQQQQAGQQGPTKAFLPDKRRAGGRPGRGGGGDGGGDEGGGSNLLVDADENERFLVSEVDVVGVEGELKEVALRALNTRANFAYTQKEVRFVEPVVRGCAAPAGKGELGPPPPVAAPTTAAQLR